jgi:hypothetical protein
MIKPVKLILPGVFLLTLGAGNFGVGSFKGREYHQVLEDLSVLESSAIIQNASPMRRIQLAKVSADRLSARLAKAQHRRDFYNLVEFGGKCIIALSFALLLPGLILTFRSRTQVAKELNASISGTSLAPQSDAPSPADRQAA